MAVAAAPALPAVRGASASAHDRRRPQAHHRAALPRRGELQGHQGTRSETGRDVVAVRGATWVAGQARAGAAVAAERPHAKGRLRGNRLAAYFVAHPGALRRDPDAEDCNGAGAGAGSHSDTGHEADPDYARPRQFLARTLSAHQIRVAAEIAETSVAMKLFTAKSSRA